MVLSGNVLNKIILRENGRVNLPSDHLFHPSQPRACFHGTHIPDQHYVHVTSCSLFSAGQRTVDKANLDALGPHDRFSKHWEDTGGLLDQSTEFREDRRVRVGLDVASTAIDELFEYADTYKCVDLSLQG